MTERVLTEIREHIAHVRLNRAERHNGLDLPMFEGIVAAAETLRERSDVRVVVLSGQGKSFCAGLDFQAFMADAANNRRLLERPADKPYNIAQAVSFVWTELPVPVVAALHGAVFGGGMQIALGADIRIAAPDLRMSVMEIEYGLVPDMGLTQSLPRLVPADVAKELTFTGRVVSAEEAKALGLVTRLSADPLRDAMELAGQIAARSPHAIRHAKRLLRDSYGMTPHASFELETDLQLELLGSPNQLEAVRAKLTKSAATFKDPE
jgi:enoyl-CoA hydratase/carnithine racemase